MHNDIILPSRLVEIGAYLLAKHPNAKALTNSNIDWLQSSVQHDWYIAGNNYVILSQSWETFKYISIISGHAGNYRGLDVTTIDIDAMKAQKAYIDSTTVGATYTNTVMNNLVGDISVTCGKILGDDYVYIHFYRPKYNNLYPEVSNTKIYFNCQITTVYFIYGHNTL